MFFLRRESASCWAKMRPNRGFLDFLFLFFAESYSSIQYKLKNEVLDFFGKNLVLRSLDRVGPKVRFSRIIKNQGTFHNFCMKA